MLSGSGPIRSGSLSTRSTSRRTTRWSPVGAAEHEPRVRHPLLDPATVRAPEEPLRGTPVVDPRAVARPRLAGRPAATSRRSRSAPPGAATSRRADPDRSAPAQSSAALMPVVARNAVPMLSHGVYVKIGPSPGRAGLHAFGDLEVRQERLLAVHVGDGAAVVAALDVQDPEPGRDERVVARPVADGRRAARRP